MNRTRLISAVGAALVAVLGVGMVVAAHDNQRQFDESLTGYQEVPALSTPGLGRFNARISKDETEIQWELTFSALETDATQSHIHFENATNNGPVMVFLCTNLGNGPAGTQACPPAGGTISGTWHSGDVLAGAAGQGIAAGEFAELIAAMRAGATYVNVHSTGHPGGAIRAQLDDHGHDN